MGCLGLGLVRVCGWFENTRSAVQADAGYFVDASVFMWRFRFGAMAVLWQVPLNSKPQS